MRGRLRDGGWTQRSDLPPGSSSNGADRPSRPYLAEQEPAITTFTVPTVDLATQPLSDFVAALRRSSCVFITGHGVSDELMTAMVGVSTEFFDLPRDLKAPTRWPGDGLWRGWQPVHEGAADLTGGRVPDLLERFEVARASGCRC